LIGADVGVTVTCGQDLDAIINADDPMIATRFQLDVLGDAGLRPTSACG